MSVEHPPILADVIQCTGCAACCASCAVGAISMNPDKEGFLRPHVDLGRCVGCGMCSNICPELNPASRSAGPLSVHACWDRSSERRAQATSGGAFLLLAELVLRQGGWVCGAVLDEDLSVRHTVTRDLVTVERMRGSKYVQSDVARAIAECSELLRAGELVLFTGTPCQVAAMSRISNRVGNGSLLAVDVLCHGAPSPLFWKAYLEYREREMCDRAVDVHFRKKSPSWTVFSLELTFKTEHRLSARCTTEDLYLRAFLGDYISRACCHSCPYVGSERVSDITLADFWGYVSETREDRNDEGGISLVMINTSEGERLFDEISPELKVVDKSFDEARRGNVPLRGTIPENPRRQQFWRDFEAGGITAVRDDYLAPIKRSWKHRASLFLNDHAYVIPTQFRSRLLGARDSVKVRTGKGS